MQRVPGGAKLPVTGSVHVAPGATGAQANNDRCCARLTLMPR